MEQILDQPLEPNPESARHWKVTVLWAFLTFTICNIIIGYLFRLLTPLLMHLVENGTHTAGEIAVLHFTIYRISVYAVALVVGHWMGKSLGLHSKLPLWQIFSLGLLIGAGSAVLQAITSDIRWWVDHREMMGLAILFQVGFKGSIFAVVGGIAAMFQRSRQLKTWLISLALVLLLIVLQLTLPRLLEI